MSLMSLFRRASSCAYQETKVVRREECIPSSRNHEDQQAFLESETTCLPPSCYGKRKHCSGALDNSQDWPTAGHTGQPCRGGHDAGYHLAVPQGLISALLALLSWVSPLEDTNHTSLAFYY